MKNLKCYMITGIVFVLIIGTLSHFLYDWSGKNYFIGLFTPVNESVWEHMKLLFFPMLLYAVFLILKLKKNYPDITSSLCFGILTGTLLIPILYYIYTAVAGRDFFIIDIAIFILSVIAAFTLSYRLTETCRLKPYTVLLCFSVSVLFICFMVFTYNPPEMKIFKNPQETVSSASTSHQHKSIISRQ